MSRHTASPMTTLARTLGALVATIATATVVSAQTVIVKDAPAGGTVELVVNNTVVATDTANANGRLTLVVPGANRADMDALIVVDSCGTRRRIVFTQPSVTAAASVARSPACSSCGPSAPSCSTSRDRTLACSCARAPSIPTRPPRRGPPCQGA